MRYAAEWMSSRSRQRLDIAAVPLLLDTSQLTQRTQARYGWADVIGVASCGQQTKKEAAVTLHLSAFHWFRLLDARTIKESDTNRPRLSFDGSGAKGGLIPALLHDA